MLGTRACSCLALFLALGCSGDDSEILFSDLPNTDDTASPAGSGGGAGTSGATSNGEAGKSPTPGGSAGGVGGAKSNAPPNSAAGTAGTNVGGATNENVGAQCKKTSRDGHDYTFCGSDSAQDFVGAANVCEQLGMHLVAIESKEENDFIASQAKEFDISGPVWIGGSDEKQEGEWRWPDGKLFWRGGPAPIGHVVEGMYANWQPTKPNNLASNGNAENCALFVFNVGWNDLECTTNETDFGFVCERQ